ncbi:MAG TPA: MliC family protein [Allosphingosinicella sp.]|nr:MliC family protein [Allosphingosinicella sp.]
MKPTNAWLAAALLAAPAMAAASSGGGRVQAGPPEVPYLCSDGHSATVVYESGSDYRHARALVTRDGQTTEMRAAPTLYGVRYRAEAGAEGGAPLAWSLRGEEAVLTEAPDDESYTREERQLVRCIRVRGAAPADAVAAAHRETH